MDEAIGSHPITSLFKNYISRSHTMNTLSLTYSNAQKQSSWIDDPFDMKGFTGVKRVSDHNCNLNDYAIELVAGFAKFKDDQYELTLDMLSSPYQLEFARLYIESIDREIEWACYGEDQTLNSEFLCKLLAMLKDSTPKTRTEFAQATTRNILVYYKDTLQNILNEACEDYYTREMNEAGYRAEIDMNHGDCHWRKY